MNGRGSIGPYQIEGFLGSGGIGEVYAAVDQDLGRRVALKALRSEYSDNLDLVERFRNEASSLARLSHPNITMLYSLFREAAAGRQNIVMVMEIVDGETLEALLRRVERISARASLAVVAQAALGLTYAHAAGIIHRDVKPSNLMVNADGLLKITDFGIARMQGSERLTRHGTLVGTLSTIAPEQIKGQEADGRSDLYSLACVLYEMLSGQKPFKGASDYELIRAKLELVPPPLTELLPDLDPELAAAVARALATDPSERFSSVAEFAEAIGATALRDEAAAIVREEILLPAGSPLVVEPVTPAEGPPTATRAASATPPAPERSGTGRASMLAGCIVLVLGIGFGGYFIHRVAQVPSVSPGVAHAKPGPAKRPPSAMSAALPVAAGLRPPPSPSPAPAPAFVASPAAVPAPSPGKGAPQDAAGGTLPAPGPAQDAAGNADQDAGHDPGQGVDAAHPAPSSAAAAADKPADALDGQVASYSADGWPVVRGVTIHLEGISPLAKGEVKPMANWITAHGNYLACTVAASGAYRCLTQHRLDLAQAILLNGGARTSADATSLYRAAEAKARIARRGVWR